MYSADPQLQPKAIRRFINRVGTDHLPRLFALRAADIAGSGLPKRDDANERFEEVVFATLAQAPPASVRDLAIDGRDVIRLLQEEGLAGPDFRGDRRIGRVLNLLFEAVMDDPQRNDRATLLGLAHDALPTL